jgi:hypothetical protein
LKIALFYKTGTFGQKKGTFGQRRGRAPLGSAHVETSKEILDVLPNMILSPRSTKAECKNKTNTTAGLFNRVVSIPDTGTGTGTGTVGRKPW